MTHETVEESPVLVLPQDPEWQQLLRDKEEFYKDRLRRTYKYQPPEVRNRTYAGYGIRIIDELFAQGQIEAWEISRTLATEQGDGFNLGSFVSVCGAIDIYTQDKEALSHSVEAEKAQLSNDTPAK